MRDIAILGFVHRTGIDIIEISRISRMVARWSERFLRRIYTEAELELCRGRVPALAARFAGKEALMKVLGTRTKGVGWREIEILSHPGGRPIVVLHGRALKRAEELSLKGLDISLTHSREYALATVIGE